MVEIRLWLFGVLLIVVCAEVVWSWYWRKGIYNLKESFANIGIMLGN